jgi:hypothetical protein
LAKLRNYRYFSEQAVDVCLSFNFSSDKLTCVDAIGDKEFANYEVEVCQPNKHFQRYL